MTTNIHECPHDHLVSVCDECEAVAVEEVEGLRADVAQATESNNAWALRCNKAEYARDEARTELSRAGVDIYALTRERDQALDLLELYRNVWAARLELDLVLRDVNAPEGTWLPKFGGAHSKYSAAKEALDGRVSEAGRVATRDGDGVGLGEHASPGDRGALRAVSGEGPRREPDAGVRRLPTETEVEVGASGTPEKAGHK